VDVRIGLVYTARELEVELPDDTDVVDLKDRVASALNGDQGVLWLVDRRGASYGIAIGKVTFVQIGTGTDKGRIGFG
jgi:hypothetical protein